MERFRVYYRKAYRPAESRSRYFDIVTAGSAAEAESIVQKMRPGEFRVILKGKTVSLGSAEKDSLEKQIVRYEAWLAEYRKPAEVFEREQIRRDIRLVKSRLAELEN